MDSSGKAKGETTPASVIAADDDPLWHRIRDFELDDPEAALTFTARLARDHAWTDDYARRVRDEYRKFIYLVATAPDVMTPSEDVDEAWHLHLSYTRSYWDDLCGKVIGRPLHHDPTEGGPDQMEHFLRCYAATLERYVRVFDVIPPQDIWPAPHLRFAPNEGYRTVRLGDYWIVRRLWSHHLGMVMCVAGIFVSVPAGGYAGLRFLQNPEAALLSGGASLIVYLVAIELLTGGPRSLVMPVTPSNPKNMRLELGSGCGGCGGCGG